jgi:hypothetical protein
LISTRPSNKPIAISHKGNVVRFLTEVPAVPLQREKIDKIPAERRSKVRFPMDMKVSYRTLDLRSISGEGRILNMSSGGMLIAPQHQLSVGARVELRIEWPLLLEGRIGLQLVAAGKVLRSGPASFAVMYHRHEFRTTSTKSRSNTSPLGNSNLLKKAAGA